MEKFRSWAGRWLPVCILCALVFTASGDSFSFPRSSRFILPVVRWLWPGASPEALHTVVVLVRKGAHVTEYALLGLLVWRALGGSRRRGWDWKVAGAAALFVLVYAATDELHQAFVPARQGSVWDVALDTAGGCAGLGLVWAWVWLKAKKDLRFEI